MLDKTKFGVNPVQVPGSEKMHLTVGPTDDVHRPLQRMCSYPELVIVGYDVSNGLSRMIFFFRCYIIYICRLECVDFSV